MAQLRNITSGRISHGPKKLPGTRVNRVEPISVAAVSSTKDNSSPLLDVLGAFKDDVEYEALMADVQEHRHQSESQEAEAESSRVSP